MKQKRVFSTITIIITLFAANVFGANMFVAEGVFSDAAQFLRLDPIAGAAARGGAYATTISDPNAANYNPAITAYITGVPHAFTIAHNAYPSDIFLEYVSLFVGGKVPFFMNVSYFHSTFEGVAANGEAIGDYVSRDVKASVNFSYKIIDALSVGGTLHGIYKHAYIYDTFILALDAGVMTSLMYGKVLASLSVHNFGFDVFNLEKGVSLLDTTAAASAGGALPLTVRFSSTLNILKRLNMHFDIDYLVGASVTPKVGISYDVLKMMTLTAGYTFNSLGGRNVFSAGADMRVELPNMKPFNIAYAIRAQQQLGLAHHFTFMFGF